MHFQFEFTIAALDFSAATRSVPSHQLIFRIDLHQQFSFSFAPFKFISSLNSNDWFYAVWYSVGNQVPSYSSVDLRYEIRHDLGSNLIFQNCSSCTSGSLYLIGITITDDFVRIDVGTAISHFSSNAGFSCNRKQKSFDGCESKRIIIHTKPISRGMTFHLPANI